LLQDSRRPATSPARQHIWHLRVDSTALAWFSPTIISSRNGLPLNMWLRLTFGRRYLCIRTLLKIELFDISGDEALNHCR